MHAVSRLYIYKNVCMQIYIYMRIDVYNFLCIYSIIIFACLSCKQDKCSECLRRAFIASVQTYNLYIHTYVHTLDVQTIHIYTYT